MAHLQGRTMLVLAIGLALTLGSALLVCVPGSRAALNPAALPPHAMAKGHEQVGGEFQAELEVAKTASPGFVQDGAMLTYTLSVENTGSVTLTATITDLLPAQVDPGGSQVWSALLAPDHLWTETLTVTVTEGYTGSLTNLLVVSSAEGATGSASTTTCVNACQAHLPLLRQAHRTGLPPREWDPRLDDLGVTLEPAPVQPGQPHWRLIKAQWADPIEAAERHHIFFEVLDEDEKRVAGQPVVVEWTGGNLTLPIKPGPPPEWGADFPMFNTLGSYDARVGGEDPSDRVVGMGLGTAEFPDVKFHTCFYLTFQWVP